MKPFLRALMLLAVGLIACSPAQSQSETASSVFPNEHGIVANLDLAKELAKGLSKDVPWYRNSSFSAGIKNRFSTSYDFQVVTDGVSYVAEKYTLGFYYPNPKGDSFISLTSPGALLYHIDDRLLEIKHGQDLYCFSGISLCSALLDLELSSVFDVVFGDKTDFVVGNETWSIGYWKDLPIAFRSATYSDQTYEKIETRYGFGKGKDGLLRIESIQENYVYPEGINAVYQLTSAFCYEGQYGGYLNEDGYRKNGPVTDSLGAENAPEYTDPYYQNKSGDFFFSPLKDATSVFVDSFDQMPDKEIYLAPLYNEKTVIENLDDAQVQNSDYAVGNCFGLFQDGTPVGYEELDGLVTRPLKI